MNVIISQGAELSINRIIIFDAAKKTDIDKSAITVKRGVWVSLTAAGKKRVRSSLVERAFHFIRLAASVISLNVHRRHMDKTQLACVAVRALPHYEEEAKERQRASGGDRKSEEYQKSVMEIIPEPIPPARDLAAASVGVNPRYVSDAKRIQQMTMER